MYNISAFLYERAAGFEAPERTCDDVLAAMARHGLHPPGLLGDFGAGTGLISRLLARRGWKVHAVEISKAMLEEALHQADTLPDEIQARLTWVQGDVTAYRMPGGLALDGAVCLCNTLNHLPEQAKVEAFLSCAFRALRPGGLLVLDTDTLPTFISFFDHPETVVWEDEHHRMTRACAFDAETGRADHIARLLRRAHGADWEVAAEERMPLQYYKESVLFEIFGASGFRILELEPFNPFPALYTGEFIPKLLWVLQKP